MRRTRRAKPAWLENDKPEIARISAAYVRHYRETGQRIAYVEWIDERGRVGITEGPAKPDRVPVHAHMAALFARATREGVETRFEEW